MNRICSLCFLILLTTALFAAQPRAEKVPIPASASARRPPEAPTNPYGNGARLDLTDDGQSYLRFLTWVQVWSRYIEQNPGTLVQGEARDHAVDVGLRRARMLLLGQITPRIQIVMHVGINNQTFNNGKKPQLFVHDAWTQYKVYDEYLSIGGGLHYWNGISRMTSASTLSLMALDAPILNWPTIERSDQFARMLGIWAKGKLGPLDYRVALNHPFEAGSDTPKAAADYNPRSYAAALTAYIQWQFLERESNLLPYTTGTYLGSKRVFNLGWGFLWHPKAMWSLGSGGESARSHDMFLTALDAFVDHPLGPGAITAYGAYYYYDFGPDHLRSIGIMNYGAGGSTINGPGNAYPMIGSGSHLYGQLGYLFKPLDLQPYVTLQSSFFEALDDVALVYEAGLNYYMVGHHAKLTLNYRNRPVFELVGGEREETTRRSELILQGMIFL